MQYSESRYKAILQATPDGIAITDLAGNITMVAESTLKLRGVDSEEFLVGKNISEFLHEEDRERASRNISLMFQGVFNGPEEYQLLRPDGTTLSVEINAAFIRDINGEPNGLVFIQREIAQRKRIEEELKDSEEIFSQFMENSPVYIFFKDVNLRSIKLSRNFENMLGKPIEEILGKTMDELFPSDFAKKMIADDTKILNGEKQIEIEEELFGRQYTTVKFPIYKNGKPKYLAGYTIDITEKNKAVKTLKMKAAELERFNNLMMGREVRMIELKKEINSLLREMGKEEKYIIHEHET